MDRLLMLVGTGATALSVGALRKAKDASASSPHGKLERNRFLKPAREASGSVGADGLALLLLGALAQV